jgi:hypothetical protein
LAKSCQKDLGVQRMISQILDRAKRLVPLATLSLVLAGCINMQSNVALYGQEQWSGVQAMQISAEFMEMMEQAETDPNASVETEGLEDWLQQAESASELANVDVELSEIDGDDGSKTYVFQASGQGYQQMNQALFNGEATISVNEVGGQRQITIDYVFEDPTAEGETSAEELTPAEQEMQQQMLAAFGLGFSFRISGGEIISSNANRVEGSTAIWENPSKIEVTLTEAARFDPQTIAVADAPEGSTFDAQALTSVMEQAVQEMQPVAAQSDAVAPQSAPDTAAPAPETQQATAAEPPAGTTGSSDESAAVTEVAPALPTESDASLPASGGILPPGSSLPQILLAGLLLAVLGVAAVFSVQRHA